MSTKQKTLVVDENYISLQGLCTIIDHHPALELSENYGSLTDLVSDINTESSQVLVISVNHSLETISKLVRSTQPRTKWLAVADLENKQLVKTLWDLNLNAIITQNCSQEEFIEALDKVVENKTFYCNSILDCIHNRHENTRTEKNRLSIRELEVIQLITKGKSTNDIATQLFVSKHTINSHRKNILKKLGLKSPVELIVYAIENGLM